MSEEKPKEATGNPAEVPVPARETEKKKAPPKKDSVGAPTYTFVHRVRDIRYTSHFVNSARRAHVDILTRSKERLERAIVLIESDSEEDRSRAQHILSTSAGMRRRSANSNPPRVLLRSLFLGLFSAFDAFTGNLLKSLYENKEELFSSLGGRSVQFADILAASDVAALKEAVLAEEIETFRRKSYTDQFQDLETRFSIRSLRDLPAWKRFIECSQRRNLITHCDGIVSAQYLKECKKAGYSDAELPKLGTEIQLNIKYVRESCELLIEIGAKLGIVLWRKCLPNEMEQADDLLNALIYDALEVERWPRAIMLGEFGASLKAYSNEKGRRTLFINYIQAIKWSGEEEKAKALLACEDWSACSRVFQLAVAVLRDEFGIAAEIMKQIGKNDELHEQFYSAWPLFRKYRRSPEFEAAYQEIYGYPYVKKAEQDASKAVAEAAAQAPGEDADDSEFPGLDADPTETGPSPSASQAAAPATPSTATESKAEAEVQPAPAVVH